MAGQIVVVDWRDAMRESGEPSKVRPAIVVGRDDLFHAGFGYLLVVPLTGDVALRISGATVEIAPTEGNMCVKTCFALSWKVQTVPKKRIRSTNACIADAILAEIRGQVARLVDR